MKASRLLSILMLLQARGRCTAAELAAAMEVSPRTILRDVDQLSAAGVPLWSERGRHGGFRLQPGWSTRLTGLTEPEAHALLLAGLPGAATELGLGAAAASARLKMVASLPSGWREQAERVGERLHIDPIDWYRARDTPRFLREVADAVWHARRLSVVYESWRGREPRELEPLGLVLKAGAWYVLAHRRGQDDVRIYRLASLVALRSVGAVFRRPRRFALDTAWQAAAARFEAGLRTLQATVRVSPRGLRWLRNERIPVAPLASGVNLPASAVGGRGRAGWQATGIALESVEGGARELLGLADEVEVLAPAALRAEMRRLARRVATLHTATGRAQGGR